MKEAYLCPSDCLGLCPKTPYTRFAYAKLVLCRVHAVCIRAEYLGFIHHTLSRMPTPQNGQKRPFCANRIYSAGTPHQTGRAAVKLDLQPFMFLPPPQVFLAENSHKTFSKNRAFARFLGRTYKALYDERCLIMSARLP